MSQAKVDKYKKEKKNRAKTIKRHKRRQVAEVLVCAGVIGLLVGYPLGKQMYKWNYEKREANKTILANNYDYWLQTYWAGNYSEYWQSTNYDDLLSSYTDAYYGDDYPEDYEDEATASDADLP